MNNTQCKRLTLNEDWTVTIIGAVIIALVVAAFGLCRFEFTWPSFGWDSVSKLIGKVLTPSNISNVLIVFLFSLVAIAAIFLLMGKSLKGLVGYPVLFILAFFAMTISGNTVMKYWGLEAVIFSLVIGLIINNFFGTPRWLKGVLSSETYIKIGLVLLGTSVLFGDLLKHGPMALLQSMIVVLGVWYFAFWLCKKMKIDEEMAIMLSSAVSICGVSAAVASAGAIQGDKKKLSYVVSLVLVIAVPMILIMPALAHLLNLNETMAGAWIGGTIDTTGAVAATGTIYGQKALEMSTIVKFSQNVLLGVAAFLISIYWAYSKRENNQYAERPSAKMIWDRFPKFILGFVLASVVFSFLLSPTDYKPALGTLKSLQGFFFTLGFVSIGLETNFKTLFNSENRRATGAFIGAQVFNVIFTLLIVWLLFGI